jgi:hypothetical protein
MRTLLAGLFVFALTGLAHADDDEKILADAQQCYVDGKYDCAIELARKAVKTQPSRAWRVIGASSCSKKDRAGAVEAWNKLDNMGRNFVRYVCKRNDIELP